MDRLLEGVEVTATGGDVAVAEVTSIAFDSRTVQPGALFVCVPGQRSDGHDFAPAAVAAGAVGLLTERPLPVAVPQAVVGAGGARPALARVACTFYDNPAESLVTVGVTGTNGKTSVTHLLAAILEAAGTSCLVVGTLDGARTTPEAPVLQEILAGARDGGRGAAALEVSSHALTQARVDGIRFDAAVFTNLSHDHLDHHGTMEAYFAAKASLFTEERAALAVVNTDDEWGRRLAGQLSIPTVPYGATDATDIVSGPGRTTFRWRDRSVTLGLTGTFHVTNAVAAGTTAMALGVPLDTVVAGLGRAGGVPGRFEVVAAGAPCTVVVDYAHTPDGLAAALASARRLADGHRVLCVFGCGGDRDRAKRPLMAALATTRADVTVITTDNPRREDPAAIIEEIVAGVVAGAEVVVEGDRRRAIERAVGQAGPGDVVLVAGKGHETVMEIGDRREPFDDRVVAAAAVAGRHEVAP